MLAGVTGDSATEKTRPALFIHQRGIELIPYPTKKKTIIPTFGLFSLGARFSGLR